MRYIVRLKISPPKSNMIVARAYVVFSSCESFAEGVSGQTARVELRGSRFHGRESQGRGHHDGGRGNVANIKHLNKRV